MMGIRTENTIEDLDKLAIWSDALRDLVSFV